MGLEAFGQAMIEQYLQMKGWRFNRDDGEFALSVRSNARDYRVRLYISGPDHDVLTIRLSTSERFGVGNSARLLERANRWNRDTCWPKASVRVSSDGLSARVVGKCSFPFVDGVPGEWFEKACDRAIAAAPDLFEQVAQATQVPSAQTLESWFRECA